MHKPRLLFVLLSEKSVALLFQCQFVKTVFLMCTNKTSVEIFQKIVPNVNSANFWNVPLVTAKQLRPISVIITKKCDNFNKQTFKLSKKGSIIHIFSKKSLEVHQYYKIKILKYRCISGDKEIKAIGYLEDLSINTANSV